MPKFTIGEYEVTFSYDPGDWSVGIRGGWEETFISWKGNGDVEIVIGFEPSDKPAADWTVNYISADRPERVHGNLHGGFKTAREFNVIYDDAAGCGTLRQMVNGDKLAAAVAQAWDYIQWSEYLDGLSDWLWGLDSHIADVEWDTEGHVTPEIRAMLDDLRNELSYDRFWCEWVKECFNHHFSDTVEVE